MDIGTAKRFFRPATIAAIVVVLLATMGLRGAIRGNASDARIAVERMATFTVEKGPLVIGLDASGTIGALDQEILLNEVEGQTTIIWITDEGVQVAKGDLLVELDVSSLDDLKVDQQILVQNAEAEFISVRETLEVTKNQALSDVDQAKLDLQFAQEDLKNFVEGQFPMDLKTVEAEITMAKETAKRTQSDFEGSQRLAEKSFITATELEADQQAALKAKLDLELAEDEKRLLTDFTYKRTLTENESAVRQNTMALERAERKAAADVVQAEAALRAASSEFEREKSKLDKILDQIEKTKIYAPADGLVVYATSAQGGGWHGSSAEPLDEGQTVRERQELIYLPKTSSFKAAVSVHESSLTKVKPGLQVRLTVNALPGKVFRGRVESVAPLPNAQSAWMNPDLKIYDTEVHLDGDVDGLRTGMSCSAEIIVESYADAVFVPVQSVVRVGGVTSAYVLDGGGAAPRPVEIGLDNNRMVRILSGLEPGERVLLSPPLSTNEAEKADLALEIEDIDEHAGGNENVKERPAISEEAGQASTPAAPPNRSPEEQAAMRKQFEEQLKQMTPEQRAELARRFGGGEGPPRVQQAAPANPSGQ